MRRIQTALTIIIIGLAIVSGCSPSSPPNTNQGDKTKVVIWSYSDSNLQELKAREASIEKKFHIDLVIESIPQNEFVRRLQESIETGVDYPGIIEWRIEANQILSADPKKCPVIPLDEYVAKSAIYRNVPASRVAWMKYGGRVYGLPHDAHPVVFVYNKTLWDDAEVDVAKIETWDEFFTEAQKLKSKHPNTYALAYDQSGMTATMLMIWQQTGTRILDENGGPTLTSPEFTEFVGWWVDKINTGVMRIWDWENFSQQLADGELAAFVAPDWWVSQVNQATAAGEYQFRVRDLPQYKTGGPRTSTWGGSFMAITKLPKNQDQLYQVIEYMLYDPSSMIARYRDTGLIPPLSTVWNDPVFGQPDSRFGGQKLTELQTELATEMPIINVGDIFWDVMFSDFGSRFGEIVAGAVSVETALQDAQAAAESRLE